MNIVGLDLVQVGTLFGSIGTAVAAVVKAMQAGRKAETADARAVAIELQREQTKKSRDTEIALLKSELETQKKQAEEFRAYIDKRLTEGDVVMKGLTGQLSVLNGNVSFIRGLLEGRDQYDKLLKETNKNINDLISTLRSSV